MPSNSNIFGSANIWRPKLWTPTENHGYDSWYLTSALYPISYIDKLQASGELIKTFEPWNLKFTAELGASGQLVAFAQYRQFPHPYTDWPYEPLASSAELIGISRTNLVPTYPRAYEYQESMQAVGELIGITRTVVTPIYYTNWPSEPLASSGQLIGIVIYA